jgi:hypothetical protein
METTPITMTENENKSPGVCLLAGEMEKLKSMITALDQDYSKFTAKNVKVSGARLRNQLLDTKKLCDALRKQVLTKMKDLPVKKKTAKVTPAEEVPVAEDAPAVVVEVTPAAAEETPAVVEKKARKPRKAAAAKVVAVKA